MASAADTGAPLLPSPVHALGRAIAIVSVHQDAGKDLRVEIENRSAQTVIGVTLVLEGHSCTSKPAWPAVSYDAPLRPKERADVRVPQDLYKQVASVAERTCHMAIPPEIEVTTIVFADGSKWDLGDEVRQKARQSGR